MASDSRHLMGCSNARLWALSLAVVCVVGHAQPTCAVFITANGTRQFYDDFEGVSTGNSPDTGKNPGHWLIRGTVLPVSDGPTPGPVQGKQYLSVTRAIPGEAAWYNDLVAEFAAEQSFYGVKIHAEWMMYVPSVTPATYRGFVLFQEGDDNIRAAIVFGDGTAGKVDYLGPDGEYRAAKSTYIPDTWQKWTMDYTVGDSQFTFSIGNGRQETVDTRTAGGVTGFHICGNHKVGSVFYLDAVEPEPAPTVLLITGQERGKGKGKRRSD